MLTRSLARSTARSAWRRSLSEWGRREGHELLRKPIPKSLQDTGKHLSVRVLMLDIDLLTRAPSAEERALAEAARAAFAKSSLSAALTQRGRRNGVAADATSTEHMLKSELRAALRAAPT